MKKTLLAIMTTALLTTSVWAKEERTISKSYSPKTAAELAIEVPVGSIELTAYNGDSVEVSVTITPKNDDSWFSKNVDLDKFEIESKHSANELNLTIDSDDIQQEWVVKVPHSMALELEMGVGKVDVDALSNSADIEVGVGNVTVETTLNDFRAISLEAGVGKTSVKGFDKNVEHSKNMVSSDVKYRGEGQHHINVEVGVGNAKVSKK